MKKEEELLQKSKNGGDGIEKDIQKAIELYNRTIELNNPKAMNNLAFLYQNGPGKVEKTLKLQ